MFSIVLLQKLKLTQMKILQGFKNEETHLPAKFLRYCHKDFLGMTTKTPKILSQDSPSSNPGPNYHYQC
jgi:hypothetical protein